MKTLQELQNQITPLENYASELQDALTQVALVDDLDEDGNNIFPEKKTIIETMAQAVQLMNDVAGIINSLPDRKQPKIDTGKKGFDFAFWQKAVEKDNKELGDVLNAIARTPNELQEDDAIWMLSDIANARETLSCLNKEFTEALK
ncbi:MAG: hypothetical protein J5770_06595 [Bacteroidaceae bacterium]|nr:hypothetical protein [Bacteroidaceae bacterium]